jgi:transglutaminase-like putative cysteine protease
VRVTLSDAQADRLFAPLSARGLELTRAQRARRLLTGADATLRLDATDETDGRVSYELSLPSRYAPSLGGGVPQRLATSVAPFAVLPDTQRLRAARELAATLAARLPAGAEQHQVVDAFSDHLSTRYRYLAPGEDGAPSSLEEFLEGDAGGHCEFFASALATMLRSRGIPCRIATGYRSTEWDPQGRVLTFRSRDAHAWVEVLDPQAGWVSVDPAPLASVEGPRGTWPDLRAALGAAWGRLTGFDAERRGEVLAWLGALPARSGRALLRDPLPAMLLLLLGLLVVVLVRERRRRRDPAGVRRYRDALRRAGLRLEPGETPRELLARAQAGALSLERLPAVRQATQDHERSRYAA